jgi:hypothetical protein
VSNLKQVEALATHAQNNFGHFDIWINNAAVSAPYGPTIDINPDTFINVVQTNIHGVYNGSIIAMRHFISRNQGKLINILGRGDRQPVPSHIPQQILIPTHSGLAKERAIKDRHHLYNPGLMKSENIKSLVDMRIV